MISFFSLTDEKVTEERSSQNEEFGKSNRPFKRRIVLWKIQWRKNSSTLDEEEFEEYEKKIKLINMSRVLLKMDSGCFDSQ